MLKLKDTLILGNETLVGDLVYFIDADGQRTNNVNVARGWKDAGKIVRAVISINKKKYETEPISRFYKQKDADRFFKVTAGGRRLHIVPSKANERYLNGYGFVFDGDGTAKVRD